MPRGGLAPEPPESDVGRGEKFVESFDISDNLTTGESLQVSPLPTGTMTLWSNGAAVSGANPVGTLGASGNLVQVSLDFTKPGIQLGQSYMLTVTYYVSAIKPLQLVKKYNVVA